MRHEWQKSAGLLLAAFTGLIIASPSQGQVRDGGRTEVRSVLKAVDANAGTITLTTATGRESATDKTYTLAKDAEIVAAARRPGLFREIKLSDLVPGNLIGLTLAADQATVESLVAEGPTVRAQVKSVSAQNKTLTVSTAGRGQPGEEKTYTLAADAEIAIDDGSGQRLSLRSGSLADLGEGTLVSLRMTIDQKQVYAIVAETPTLAGSVKSVDAAKKSLTLSTRPGRDGEAGEEQTVVLAPNAPVLVDDGRGRRLSLKEGTFADVAVGSSATVKLSLDRTRATLLRVEGVTLMGLLKSVDADKFTVTFAVPKGRGEAPEEKTFPVAKDARISLDGAATTLANLKPDDHGPYVQLRLGLDQKTVQSLAAQSPRPR